MKTDYQQLWEQLNVKISKQIWFQLRPPLRDQLEHPPYSQLWFQLRNRLGDQLWHRLNAQLDDLLDDQLQSKGIG